MLSKLLLIILLAGFVYSDGEIRQLHPDVGLNVKILIKKYGYPLEVHTVVTEDGYVLEMHRIPHGRNNTITGEQPAVLVIPGLEGSAADWVNMGSEKSLGFILADEGYDVWLGNYRGTTWSRKHITLDPDVDKKEFWSYSFHEIGNYDVAKLIDYVLNSTNQQNLFYIGHSQGATSLFTLASEKLEYNNKIRLAGMLAPAVYMEHMKSPLGYFLTIFKDELEALVEKYKFYEILPHYPVLTLLGQLFCNDDSPLQDICALIFYAAGGYSPQQMNKTMIPVIVSNTPAGSSFRQFQHIAQLWSSGTFQQYDYGEDENMAKYGQPTPPKYNLAQVTVPLAIYYGTRDILIVEKDVDRLAAEVPNLIAKHRIEGFNHLDFMWGVDAVPLVYKDLLDLMKQYQP